MNQAGKPVPPSDFTFDMKGSWDVPPAEREKRLLVRRADLRALRTRVDRLKYRLMHPLKDAPTWAAVFFGMAFTAAMTLFGFVAIEDQNLEQWAITAMWAVLIAGIVMGILCLVFGHNMKDLREREIEYICNEMDDLLAAPNVEDEGQS